MDAQGLEPPLVVVLVLGTPALPGLEGVPLPPQIARWEFEGYLQLTP